LPQGGGGGLEDGLDHVTSFAYLGALSRAIRNHGNRTMKRATSIKATPAMTMPTTDHRCDPGAFCHDRTTIQTRKPAADRGRLPTSTASQALLKMRRR